MSNQKIVLFTAFILFFAGCATPAEVKQLSVKQAEYFDAAIEAVSRQSEALILASEKLAGIAKQKIDREAEETDTLYVNLFTEDDFDLNEENVSLAIDDISSARQTALAQKAKLDNRLDKIKAKSKELKQYLVKMKEVHRAMDAYIQSEKAGEKVVNDVLAHPSVNALLDTTNDLIPKVQGGIDDLSNLLNQVGE